MADLYKFRGNCDGKLVEFGLELSPVYRHDCYIVDACKGIYEPEVLWVFVNVLKAGDIAIDVGANIGFHSLFMSKIVGENGRIIAFEPVEENRKRLDRNIEINSVDNITVRHEPVWSHQETVALYKSLDDLSSSAVGWNPGLWEKDNPKTVELKPQPLELQAVTIDSLKVKPRLIKVDIEGGEFLAMLGARQALKDGVVIVSELNPFGMQQLKYTDEDYRAYMRGFGYDVFLLWEKNILPSLVPPKMKIRYEEGIGVKNVMFARLDDLHHFWPESVP